MATQQTEFTQEQITASKAEGKRLRDIQNHRHRLSGQKIGRNDYCHCGSGLKSKYCHNDPNALRNPANVPTVLGLYRPKRMRRKHIN